VFLVFTLLLVVVQAPNVMTIAGIVTVGTVIAKIVKTAEIVIVIAGKTMTSIVTVRLPKSKKIMIVLTGIAMTVSRRNERQKGLF
jgi:hypothetical protein